MSKRRERGKMEVFYPGINKDIVFSPSEEYARGYLHEGPFCEKKIIKMEWCGCNSIEALRNPMQFEDVVIYYEN